MEAKQEITIQVIESKQFKIAKTGYDQQEVDEFLDSICDELEVREKEMADLRRQMELLKAQKRQEEAKPGVVPPPRPAAPDGEFREILEMAQRVKAQTISDAEAKAAEIIAHAEEEADERMGGLAQEKERLTREVAELKAAGKAYRDQLQAMIKAHQEALDKTATLF